MHSEDHDTDSLKGVSLPGFYWDNAHGLYVHEVSGPINYCDGSEEYLTNIFRDHARDCADNPGYAETFVKDWPTRYHLSPLRTNLLKAVEDIFPASCNVLELGAGAGALTPWLCGRFRSVDAVEGSMDRAKVLRLRAARFENLRIFVGDISKMAFPNKYDLIILVGVLEYIPFYNSTSLSHGAVCVDFLSRLMGCLSDDGVLVVATENKLGAKYLSGFPEDHNGVLFSGIMDYPCKSPITFSRNELEDILKAAGFTGLKFYHPFPDYKFPMTILREDPRLYDIDVQGFLRGLFDDPARGRTFLFHDSLFVKALVKARLLHHFSNSFLVLCSKDRTRGLETDWIVRKFWNRSDVRPVFHHTISLTDQNGSFFVERRPLEGGSLENESGQVRFTLSERAAYVEGENVSQEAYKAVYQNDGYVVLTKLLTEITAYLDDRHYSGSLDPKGYRLMQGRALDCCFWNLVRTEKGELVQVDGKWAKVGVIPLDFVIFRNLLYLFNEVNPFVKEENSFQFALPIMRKVFPRFDEARLDECVKQEIAFQDSIRTNPTNAAELMFAGRVKSALTLVTQFSEILEMESRVKAVQSGRGWKLLNKYYELKRLPKRLRVKGALAAARIQALIGQLVGRSK